MKDWEEALAFALALPGTAIGSYYGVPSPKVNGKAILAPGREAGSFCLMVTLAEKEMLLETDPDTFWQTDHYRGYPAVLVRFGTDADARIRTYITRAWWDRAPRALRTVYGERP
jgi:hypothetical protein